jgi:hypothetical protein
MSNQRTPIGDLRELTGRREHGGVNVHSEQFP